MKKVLLKAIILSLLLVIMTSCSEKELTKNEAKNAMLQYLEEKYNKQFEIQSIEKNDIGLNGWEHDYFFVVIDDSNEYFKAKMYTDGKHKKDDYAKIIFSSEVEEELYKIVEKHTDLILTDFSPEYYLTKEQYKNKDDYMKSKDFILHCTITPISNDEEEGLHNVYSWMKEMKDKEYSFQTCIKYNGKELSVLYDKDKDLYSFQKLIDIWNDTNTIN